MSEPSKSKLKNILPAILFILATLILVYFIVSPSRMDNSSTAAVKISAEDLSIAFSKNDSTADDTYNRKVLYVTGTIVETGSEEAGQPFVLLQGAGTGKPDVQCIFPGSDVAPMIQSFKKGQTLSIEGVCDGLQNNIILRGCRVP
ncbi:MAG TPA: hypothetical protein VFC63_06935 [Blastocatellia bacterium]|nr:hypothetical protein [Blastocatellia bacterium]